MRKQNRPFHVLQKPDIFTCYEQDDIRFLMGVMSMMCNDVLQLLFVGKHSQMRIDWHCEASTG
jgi:hypothetical protein